MTLTYAYAADIFKTEKTEDGDLFVFGKAAGPELDLDRQICDPNWLAKAMPSWYEFGNIRAQHTAVAAGIGTVLDDTGGGTWNLKSLVVDSDAIRKVEKKVYKGYSIGIKNARVIKDAKAPKGRIVDGDIVEISLVDRPSNPTAVLSVCKAAGGSMTAVDMAGDLLFKLRGEPSVDVIEKVLSGDLHKSLASMDPDDARDVAGDALIELCDRLSDQVELLKAAIADGDPADVLELFTVTEAIGKFVKDDTDNGDVVGAIEKALSGDSGSPIATLLKAEITKAVAEVKEPLEAKIESLQADLTKALAVPRSGGPVLRVQPNAPTLNKSAEADRLSATADRTADPELKLAYQALATKTREVPA